MKGGDTMALVCNTVLSRQARSTSGQAATASEASLHLDNERYIEAGSAYFGQAFAEALGLISDLELHNPERAGLRLRSIASLLEYALGQYEASVEFGSRSGLNEYHERKLRDAGLDREGVRQVLREALSHGFLMEDDERIETLAANFDQIGYSDLMGLYIRRVREIHDLTATVSEGGEPGDDAVAWQELGWKLTTLFAQTLEVGKAIAILNTLTFRLPSGALASAANRGEPSKPNIYKE